MALIKNILVGLIAGLGGSALDKTYTGIGNPSGAVALSADRFIVADDEDNDLRIYNRNNPGKPAQTINLSKLFKGDIEDGDDLEIDLEGAAEIKGTYFWLGSHSTSRKGKDRPARRRLFALTLTNKAKDQFEAAKVGEIYTGLIDDLQKDSRFDTYAFGQARTIPPKDIGGLSIEGLAATPGQTLLIGFRNPLAGGQIKNGRLVGAKAIIIELSNPFDVMGGSEAKFADPLELDLGGFGIRDIVWRKGSQYLIVAGPYHANDSEDGAHQEAFRLYDWNKASGGLRQLDNIDLGSLNIEAAVFYPGQPDTVQLLSDDGKLGKGDRFRSREIKL